MAIQSTNRLSSLYTISVTAGEAVSQYDVVYNDSSTGKVYKAVCNDTQAKSEVIGIITQSGGISANGTGTLVVQGPVTNGAWSWTANKWVYLNSTSGTLTQTLTTVNGQYAIPVGLALSVAQIFIYPTSGWVVNNPNNVSVGVKAIPFSQTSGTLSIFTPAANTVITGITAVVSSAASATGGTVQVGTASDTDSVMDTASIDLMLTGNHIYDPYVSVGATPSEYLLTVTAGGLRSRQYENCYLILNNK